jgi:hypothetical protein
LGSPDVSAQSGAAHQKYSSCKDCLILFCFVLVALVFELRASHLLDSSYCLSHSSSPLL